MGIDLLKNLILDGLPIWIICLGGLLCLFVDALSFRRANSVCYFLGVTTLVVSLGAAFWMWGYQSQSTTGLILSDRLTVFFIILVVLVGIVTLLNTYSYLKVLGTGLGGDLSQSRMNPGGIVELLLFLMVGMIFLFSSDNLIVIFVGLETMSLATYVLVSSNRQDIRSNEAALKYYVTGSVASALFLYGIALLYGSYGTLNLAEMAPMVSATSSLLLQRIALSMILFGLFFKMAVVPFHFWVPDVYEGAPAPVTGFMATGVKVAAVALFIRLLQSIGGIAPEAAMSVLKGGIILTLLVGNLAALVQDDIKRMLAYSSIAHAGYLLLGILVGYEGGRLDSAALSPVLFYLLGYSLMTLGAFAVLSVMIQDTKEVTQFADLAGLGYSRPFLAAAFSLFMLSLLGVPATVGFMAKYGIFSLVLQKGEVGLVLFAIITTVISASYYLKPIVFMYFRGTSQRYPITEVPLPLMFSLVFCSTAVVVLGIMPGDYVEMSILAAAALR